MNEAIVLLLLLWAALLLPGALRSRKSSPHSTVGGFERAMNVLRANPGQGRELMVPSDAGRIVGDAEGRAAAGDGLRGPQYNGSNGHASRTESPMMARRRSWFLRALGGTGVTFVLALVVGSWTWLAFAALLLVTIGYTALLRRLKLQREQARTVVRGLDLSPASVPASDVDPSVAWEDAAQGLDGGGASVIDHAPVEDGGLALQSVRLRRWDD